MDDRDDVIFQPSTKLRLYLMYTAYFPESERQFKFAFQKSERVKDRREKKEKKSGRRSAERERAKTWRISDAGALGTAEREERSGESAERQAFLSSFPQERNPDSAGGVFTKMIH